jgi:hypothetical protein
MMSSKLLDDSFNDRSTLPAGTFKSAVRIEKYLSPYDKRSSVAPILNKSNDEDYGTQANRPESAGELAK